MKLMDIFKNIELENCEISNFTRAETESHTVISIRIKKNRVLDVPEFVNRGRQN